MTKFLLVPTNHTLPTVLHFPTKRLPYYKQITASLVLCACSGLPSAVIEREPSTNASARAVKKKAGRQLVPLLVQHTPKVGQLRHAPARSGRYRKGSSSF